MENEKDEEIELSPEKLAEARQIVQIKAALYEQCFSKGIIYGCASVFALCVLALALLHCLPEWGATLITVVVGLTLGLIGYYIRRKVAGDKLLEEMKRICINGEALETISGDKLVQKVKRDLEKEE